MSNMDRWKKFLDRKRWKYKEVDTEWGKRYMVKVYNKFSRCHVFISEKKVNFCFFTGQPRKITSKILAEKPKFNVGKQMGFCITKRYDALYMYRSSGSKVFNMGIDGPSMLMSQIGRVITSGKRPQDTLDILFYKKKSIPRNKFHQIINFYLELNGFESEWKLSQSTLMKACYPGMKKFPDNLIIKPIARYYRKPNATFQSIYKKIFKYNSKIIRKRLPELTGSHVKLAMLFKKRFNRGEMEKFIQNTPNDLRFDDYNKKQVIEFFNNFSNQKLISLFSAEKSGHRGYIRDAMNQWGRNKDKLTIPDKFKTWQELHDDLSTQYRRLQHKDYEFNIDPQVIKIHGVKLDKETVVVPHTRHELLEWGTRMHNCIASYHQSFHENKTILLGIKEDGKIKYNIEIRGGRIYQFMSDFNRRADKDVIKKYAKVFWDYGLLNEPLEENNGNRIF